MTQINQYSLEATVINDEDFYDVDYWNGATYETRKISGANLKSILNPPSTNVYTDDDTITDETRTVTLSGNTSVNKLVFDNGTDPILSLTGDRNVGVGTLSPTERFHVYGGNILLEDSFKVTFGAPGSGPFIQFGQLGNPSNYMLLSSSGGDNKLDIKTRDFKIYSNFGDTNNTAFYVSQANHKIGFGTNSPVSHVHVFGNTNTALEVEADSSTASLYLRRSNSNAGVAQFNCTNLGRLQIMSSDYMGLFPNNSEAMRLEEDGKIGINQTVPTALLELVSQGGLSSDISFLVRNSSDTNDIFKIQGDGLIGINRSSPNADLDILGSSASSGHHIFRLRDNADTYDAMSIDGIGRMRTGGIMSVGIDRIGGGTNGILRVYSSGNNTDIVQFKNSSNTNIFTFNQSGSGAKLNMSDGTNTNISLNAGGTGFYKNSFMFGATVTPSARLQVRAPGDLGSSLAFLIRDNSDVNDLFDIRGNGDLYTNGNQGLSNTYTFGGGSSGDIASMTFTNGILTAVTTVP